MSDLPTVTTTASLRVQRGLRVSTLARWLDTVPADAEISVKVQDTADDRFGGGPDYRATAFVATWEGPL